MLSLVDLAWAGALSIVIGRVLASALSAILFYAQKLMLGWVGVVAGMFYGFFLSVWATSGRRCWAGWPMRAASISVKACAGIFP